ncbi:hypothetical protein XU18_0896 [Perkinsela sp. CCAP 1560/4]|nr:hypothetical protein XU18_0896 [Perkinsela sp. CCAP 1560/4]|eukprot:KNH08610.1 hypothetical protein XU18_0896 [Perkinsela sp. CCAP 1560/4]
MLRGKKLGFLTSKQRKNAVNALKKLFYAESSYGESLANAEIQWISDWAQEKSNKYDRQMLIFRKALKNRITHEMPLQYILQTQPFHGLTIHCSAPVFIPRPETEHWVDWILQRKASMYSRVLDLCTGTGCIGLTMAKKNPSWTVWCVDVDRKACALAKRNKMMNNIDNAFILHGNLYEALTKASGKKSLQSWQKSQNFDDQRRSDFSSFFDMIVANPPYISTTEYTDLPLSVRNYESSLSLIGNKTLGSPRATKDRTQSDLDYLQYYKEIVDTAPFFLKKANSGEMPSLALELGTDSQRIRQLLDKKYSNVQLHTDYAGKERVITASLDPKYK